MSIAEKIAALPPQTQRFLQNYIDVLYQAHLQAQNTYVEQGWVGGFEELRSTYTSLQLQKQALNWRADE